MKYFYLHYKMTGIVLNKVSICFIKIHNTDPLAVQVTFKKTGMSVDFDVLRI